MNHADSINAHQPLALWGGLECTVNRVQDAYFSQMERNGHAVRADDLERFASIGVTALRYPVLWERTAPNGLARADWSWSDERLDGLRQLGIMPIVGLVHHGSGPRHTSLVDPGFAEGLAEFAGAVARRYPWVTHYTPVNEPLTTARFSGLAGVWYPHGRDDRTFVQALVNQCRAVVLSMRAIREVNPAARLVQTDDISKTTSTPELAHIAAFFNERRWLSWDLLCGRVDTGHALWEYLAGSGVPVAELLWFRDNPCPPDIIGVNYYITSERWLDHRLERYEEQFHCNVDGVPHADIHSARVLATPTPGIGPLLGEVWERYRLPVAVTEAHIDANREDQMRWLLEIWDAASRLRADGADIRAVTVWALLGSYDWNCLVTQCKGYYEPGPFDVRSEPPRPTAVANLMRELVSGRPLSHPVLHGLGWWRRPGRFLCAPVSHAGNDGINAGLMREDGAPANFSTGQQPGESLSKHLSEHAGQQPILIIGATGTLGSAFVRLCTQRSLAHRSFNRQQFDMADPAAVERMIAIYRPWAIVNAGGYVKVDAAQSDTDACFRANTVAPAVLAAACARHDVQLLTFSGDLVFDGQQRTPYVESDPVAPLNVYGQSKAAAERKVLAVCPQALVVRTSAFFGPWDRHNFVTIALTTLAAGMPLAAAADMQVSPTYVPDLVNVCLDLLVDGESGIWHLSNGEALGWADLARRAAAAAGVNADSLDAVPAASLGLAAPRPRYSALGSERAILMPTLDHAIERYLAAQDALVPAGLQGRARRIVTITGMATAAGAVPVSESESASATAHAGKISYLKPSTVGQGRAGARIDARRQACKEARKEARKQSQGQARTGMPEGGPGTQSAARSVAVAAAPSATTPATAPETAPADVLTSR